LGRRKTSSGRSLVRYKAEENPSRLLLLGLAAVGTGLGLSMLFLASKTDAGSVAKMLAIASSYIGVKEYPPGSNRGPVVDKFNEGTGLAWCAYFVSYVLKQAGIATKTISSVQALYEKARSLGVVSSTPSVGAVFLHITGSGITGKGYDHTGFVAAVAPGGGSFATIEGNATDAVGAGSFARHPTGQYRFVPFSALSKVFSA